MKIAVLGTGMVGQIISEKLSELGHDVIIGTRDVEDTLAKTGPDIYGRPSFREWYADHPVIKFGPFSEAAIYAEFIVNATNGGASIDALKLAGEKNLADKIMLDIANPLDFSKGMPPTLLVSNTNSLGEQIQKNFPETRVVKSLNTMNAGIMVNPSLLPDDHHVFLSGNDAGSKSEVKELLMSFGWKENNILDLGDITTSRGTEQLLPLWAMLYGNFQNPMYNFKIVRA
jgi:8-hydroxy-5-deazaflavin:NADPH oxidoreductase